jgi:hypothetical protein
MYNSKQVQKFLRDYYVGKIIESSYVYQSFSSYISEESFHKILQRMVKSGELYMFAKGLYRFSQFGTSPFPTKIELYSTYINNQRGSFSGDSLLYSLGFIEEPKEYVIYTNGTSFNQRNIGNVVLKHTDVLFNNSVRAIFEALEVFDYFSDHNLDKEDPDDIGSLLIEHARKSLELYDSRSFAEASLIKPHLDKVLGTYRLMLKLSGTSESINKEQKIR